MPGILPMPCRNVSACFPCNDLPSTNTSSEGADVIQDYSIQWGNLQTNTPPLGSLFSAVGCTVVCAADTPDEAFLCGQRAQASCAINNWNPPPTDPPICLNFPCAPTNPPPTPPPIPSFGNQPEACTAFCDDSVPFTFAVPMGSMVSSSQAMANRMASSYACRQATIHKTCLSMVSPLVCFNSPSTLTFVASGRFVDPANNVWTLMGGTLPDGFDFSSTTAGATLVLNGTPTVLGSSTFTIRVTCPSGDFAERTYTVTCGGIITADPLPDANVGAAYDQTFASSGITDQLTWVISNGQLPQGLMLDPDTGELTGTPTMSGDFVFTVLVSNGTDVCERQYHLTVAGCFIDASPNPNLTNFNQPLARSGGLASFTDQNVFVGWCYLNHTFQPNPLNLGAGNIVQNNVCAAGRYLAGFDFTLNTNFWIDLTLNVIRNLGHAAAGAQPQNINANGDLAIQGGGQSFIYTAATNTFSADLNAVDGYSLTQINNSRQSVGIKSVAGDIHAFVRSATGVYTDIHPGGGAGTFSTYTNSYQQSINSSGHAAAVWTGGGVDRVFANFGAGSLFLSGALVLGPQATIINDSDVVAWDDSGSGHVFIWQSGLVTDLGNLGVLKGFNNSGIAVGHDMAQTKAWIYANGVKSDLITKIPSAAANGWTSIIFVYDISDDNFVSGFGVQNGVVTLFVAKLCL